MLRDGGDPKIEDSSQFPEADTLYDFLLENQADIAQQVETEIKGIRHSVRHTKLKAEFATQVLEMTALNLGLASWKDIDLDNPPPELRTALLQALQDIGDDQFSSLKEKFINKLDSKLQVVDFSENSIKKLRMYILNRDNPKAFSPANRFKKLFPNSGNSATSAKNSCTVTIFFADKSDSGLETRIEQVMNQLLDEGEYRTIKSSGIQNIVDGRNIIFSVKFVNEPEEPEGRNNKQPEP